MESTWYLSRVTDPKSRTEIPVEVRKRDGRLSAASAAKFQAAEVAIWYAVRASRFTEAVEKLKAGLGQQFTKDAPPAAKNRDDTVSSPSPEPRPVEAVAPEHRRSRAKSHAPKPKPPKRTTARKSAKGGAK